MVRLCVIKGCYKKHRSYGFCPKHLYLFVEKQRMEHLRNKKPLKNFKVYSIDPGEYVQFKVDPVDITV